MDPGNCFQLLDSQVSISDQLYTMLFIAIHTPVPCTIGLPTSGNYWLLCTIVSCHNLLQARGIMGNWNITSSRQAMINYNLYFNSQHHDPCHITPANHKNSCYMQEWVGLSAVCIISSLLKSSVVQFSSGIELTFQVASSWREVRRQLPPPLLCPCWRYEVSMGFPTRLLTTVDWTVEK